MQFAVKARVTDRHNLVAAEGAIKVYDSCVLITVRERGNVDLLGVNLVPKISVVPYQVFTCGRDRIGTLITLKPAECGVALVYAGRRRRGRCWCGRAKELGIGRSQ